MENGGGRVLGKYELLERVGSGGMGEVWKARDTQLNRLVAVKLLQRTDPEDLARFRREAQAVGRLSHPHIAALYECSDDPPFLVMPYIEGVPLDRYQPASGDPVRARVAALRDAARAVQHAHEQGIVHRDLKPANILVDAKGHAFVLDFGLARGGRDSTSAMTLTGDVLGTPSYMAPEQARGDVHAVDARTDVYGLGAALYTILSGRPPHLGSTAIDIVMKVIREEPPPPGGEADLRTVCLKAIEKEPSRRYATAAEFAADLERGLVGEPIVARPASLIYKARRRIMRNKLAAAAFGCLLAAILGAAYVTLSPGRIRVKAPPDAALFVDGKRQSSLEAAVWPPRKILVRVTRDGFEDFETEVVVRPRAAEEVAPALVSRFGRLSVRTTPPGAEVLFDGKALGLSPLESAQVPTGRHEVVLRLADHEDHVEAPFVRPGEEATVLERRLRHQQGTLTLSSEPGEVAVELLPSGGGERRVTASPSQGLPVDTGTYRGIARAHNRFDRRFDLAVDAGREERLHLTLNPMLLWSCGVRATLWDYAAGDVDGGGLPDVVVLWSNPARLAALSGRTGRLLWHEVLPASENSSAVLDLADLDGDLELEILVTGPAWGHVAVHSAATGKRLSTWPTGNALWVRAPGDVDGDGLPDAAVAMQGGGLRFLSGRTGRELWTVPVPGDPIIEIEWVPFGPDGARKLLVGMRGGSVILLDPAGRSVLWRSPASCAGPPLPMRLKEGWGVAIASPDKSLSAWPLGASQPLWRREGLEGDNRLPGATGDLDGDGVDDVVWGNGRKLFIVDGATGEIRKSLDVPVSWGGLVLCDVSGDDRPDIVVPAENALLALDGGSGEVLWRYVTESSIFIGPLLADFNGDGRQDATIVEEGTGEVNLLSLTEPPNLWKQAGTSWNTSAVSPVEDGVLVIGHGISWLSARDGAVRGRLDISGTEHGVAADLDGDGAPEAVAQGFAGLALVQLGETLKVLWTAPLLVGTEQLAFDDVTGDGVQDVFFGDTFSRRRIGAVDGATGDLLWERPLLPTHHARFALRDGLLWVGSEQGVVALLTRTGEERARFSTEAPAGTVHFIGPDLVFGTANGRLHRVGWDRAAATFAARWRTELGDGLPAHAMTVTDSLAVAVTHGGRARGIDPSNGRVRWSVFLEDSATTAGVAATDLDGDGLPETAVATETGRLRVLRGSDGRTIWEWRLPGKPTEAIPSWADVDGDGAADLLVPWRDNHLYAFLVKAPSAAPMLWSHTRRRSLAVALEASQWQERGVAGAAFLREGDWDALAALVREGAPAWVSYRAAMAARSARAPARFASMAEAAVRAGCRRLDLALAMMEALPEAEASAALARALETVPTATLSAELPAAARPEVWRRAAGTLGAAGLWERALWAYAAAGAVAEAEEAFVRAEAAGAERGLILVIRARCREAKGRISEARRDYESARAVEELARMDAAGAAAGRDGAAAWQEGRHAEAIRLLERATALAPGSPVLWNDLAWFLATAPGATAEAGRRALEGSRRAIELLRAERADSGDKLAMYLDTLAAAHFAAGEAAEAARVQREALKHLVRDDWRAEFNERLQKYER